MRESIIFTAPFKGKPLTANANEWSRKLATIGISRAASTLRNRKYRGLSDYECIWGDVQVHNRKHAKIPEDMINAVIMDTRKAREIAKEHGISESTVNEIRRKHTPSERKIDRAFRVFCF